MSENFKSIEYEFYSIFYDILKEAFPKCSFASYIDKTNNIYGFHIVSNYTNTYEIRRFGKKYKMFDGMIGSINRCIFDLETEGVVVPSYIILKEKYANLKSMSDLVTIWKLQGLTE